MSCNNLVMFLGQASTEIDLEHVGVGTVRILCPNFKQNIKYLNHILPNTVPGTVNGSSVVRRTRPKGPFVKIWGCNTKDRKGKEACSLHFIGESDLIKASEEALGQDFDEDIFRSRVTTVTLFDGKIEFTFRNGSVKTIKRTDIRHSPLSGKVICGYCGAKLHRENQKGDYDAIWRCSGKKKTGNCNLSKRIKDGDLMKAATQVLGLKYADDNEIRAKVESVKVCEKSFIFIVKNGEKVRWLRE